MQLGGDLGEEMQGKQVLIRGPEFSQNGYLLTAMVSHDISLIYHLDQAPQEEGKAINLAKGTNKFCLNKVAHFLFCSYKSHMGDNS